MVEECPICHSDEVSTILTQPEKDGEILVSYSCDNCGHYIGHLHKNPKGE